MHIIQEKLIKLIHEQEVSGLTLREIGRRIGEPDSPQKIKHHLNQLAQRGLVRFDKKNKRIERIRSGRVTGTRLISIPILGSANCGEALTFAEEYAEGYVRVSPGMLGAAIAKRPESLFAVRAVGDSMNRADVLNNTIDDGDFVIVDRSQTNPQNNQYVLSVIDGMANIKKMIRHYKKVMLVSESSQDIPPIYIHENDFDGRYFVNGTVVAVMKRPDELVAMRNASAQDVLNNLGSQSREEYEYYKSL